VFVTALKERPRSSEYNGTVSTTISGRTCQHWSSQSPHAHGYHGLADQENYCRDPNDNGAPWCYTTDSYRPTEFCLIYTEEGEWHATCSLRLCALVLKRGITQIFCYESHSLFDVNWRKITSTNTPSRSVSNNCHIKCLHSCIYSFIHLSINLFMLYSFSFFLFCVIITA